MRVVVDGVLRQQWDDGTETYSEWDETGTLITERPYTTDELAQKAARVAGETTTTNEADIGNKIETVDMPAMQAIIDDTNANINANPAARIKDIAKAIRRLDRKVLGLLDGSE